MILLARGVAKAWSVELSLAAIVNSLSLSACADSADNRLSSDVERLLGKDFSPGVGYVLGMAPLDEWIASWCGHPDMADILAETMRTEVDRSVCISGQEKREAQVWLRAFTLTLTNDLRRYVDTHGGLPDRPPWPGAPDSSSPPCKTITTQQIESFRKQLAQDLAYIDRSKREAACRPAPGP